MGWYVDDEKGLTRDSFVDITKSNDYSLLSWQVIDNNLKKSIFQSQITSPLHSPAEWRVKTISGTRVLTTGLIPPIPPFEPVPPVTRQRVLYTGSNPPETTQVFYTTFKENLSDELEPRRYIYLSE